MTDLATLGLVVDASQIPPATAKLDQLTAAGGRAEKAVDALGKEAVQSGAQIKSASAEAAAYAANVQRMAANTTLTGSTVSNLGKATTTAAGNVSRLSSEVGTLTGKLVAGDIGAQSLTTSIGRVSLAALAAAPILGVVAAAAGALGLAMLGVKQQAADDADMQNYIKTLGLTDKEIKKLTDTTVTWGDVSKATFQVLAEKAGFSAGQVTHFFTDAFRSVGEFGKFSVAIILAAFAAMVKGLADLALNIPSLIGSAFNAAANLGIAAIEKLLNVTVAGLNKASGFINSVLGTSIGMIGEVHLPRLENTFGSTMRAIGADVSGTFHSVFNATEATFDEISARGAALRRQQVAEQAADIIADRTNKAAKAHRDRAKAATEEADALKKLHDNLALLMSQDWDVKVSDLKPISRAPELKDNILPEVSQEQLLAGPNALLEKLQEIAAQSQATAQIMQDAFGNVGGVFGTLITGITDYATAQQQLSIEVLKGNTTQAQADKALSTLRMKNTASMLSALKGLFKEHSAGYKVMTAIEKAYAIFQAVTSAIAIARDIAHTASSVANSAVRTTANTAEGGSKIFAELGPWAFPVVAAMVALLATLGAKGGGGGGGATIPNVDDLQAAQGAGTVLGDSKAKSESIKNSLEIVAANTNKDLEYTNEMLVTLRNIDVGISKLAGTIAQQIQVGNLFDTSSLNLGTTGKSSFLGLFGKSVTRTLADKGLVISGSPLNLASHYKNEALWDAAMRQVTGSSVADILANGLYGSSYTRTDEQRTKKGLLGGGSSTGVDYDTGGLSSEITDLFVQVIGSMKDSILAASKVVGLEGAEALVNAFQVKIGQISFEDMTGDQIEDQLNAIFSSIGDDMAGAVFPALREMQKVGEGLLETFMRVAREYQVVDVELQSIGKTFGMTGVESLAARDALVQLFGTVDEFISQTDFFKDQFLSVSEQVAPIQAAVIAEMQRLGVSGVTTRDEFKNLVLGLDLTTDAGRQMYASLMAVAPAFDKVLDYFDQANKATVDGLQSTIDQFNNFAASLKKYRDTLFQTDTAQGNAYATLKAKFIATSNLAATGDATALGGLEQSGKDFLTAAKNNASTLQQYLRDVAVVARGVDSGIAASEDAADYAQLQLDALKNATTILQQISGNTATMATALTQAQTVPTPATAAVPGSSSAAAPADPQVIEQNQTIIDQNATIISQNATMLRLWQRFDGDGLLIRTDDDSPILTQAAE
jgi:hypothetical protein